MINLSQDQKEQAIQIARDVIENGRVEGSTLEGEVEFECEERGLQDCAEMARYAASELSSK